MNTAFLTWSIVLGGWILPKVGTPEIDDAPIVSRPMPRAASSELQSGPRRTAPAAPPAYGGGDYSPRGAATPMHSPSQAARRQMPPIPTAPSGGPSQNTGYPPRNFSSPAAGMPAGPRNPYGPTMGSPQGRVQPARIGVGAPTGPGVAASIQKPFSNYQQLPIVSPYLNLERRDGLDFDNYNTLVRPFVEQYQQNNLLQNEIQSLQNTIGRQQRSLQELNRQTEFYRGYTEPRFFQDTGGFFPEP